MRALLVIAVVVGCGGGSEPAPAPGSGSATDARRTTNEQVIETLRKAIDDRYSYRDRLGLDWPKLFADARPGLLAATSNTELVTGLTAVLANAKDAHISLWVEGTPPIATDPSKIELNIDIKAVQKKVALYKIDRCINFGTVGASAYAYVLVNGIENGRCDNVVRDWAAGYNKVAESPGLILDLRGNAGGNEVFAQQIAGYFVDKPAPYVMSEARDAAAPGGFQARITRTLLPAGTLYRKPVVVLTGQWVGSSAESFVLMMRAAGATLIGARTRGASANPKDIALGDSIHVNLPSWRALLLDGSLLEGAGVAPDIELHPTAEEIRTVDPIIDAAIEALERKRTAKSRW